MSAFITQPEITCGLFAHEVGSTTTGSRTPSRSIEIRAIGDRGEERVGAGSFLATGAKIGEAVLTLLETTHEQRI